MYLRGWFMSRRYDRKIDIIEAARGEEWGKAFKTFLQMPGREREWEDKKVLAAKKCLSGSLNYLFIVTANSRLVPISIEKEKFSPCRLDRSFSCFSLAISSLIHFNVSSSAKQVNRNFFLISFHSLRPPTAHRTNDDLGNISCWKSWSWI